MSSQGLIVNLLGGGRDFFAHRKNTEVTDKE